MTREKFNDARIILAQIHKKSVDLEAIVSEMDKPQNEIRLSRLVLTVPSQALRGILQAQKAQLEQEIAQLESDLANL